MTDISATSTTTDQSFDDWLRGNLRPGFKPTGNAAEDIEWLRRMSGLIVEDGPDVDGVTR